MFLVKNQGTLVIKLIEIAIWKNLNCSIRTKNGEVKIPLAKKYEIAEESHVTSFHSLTVTKMNKSGLFLLRDVPQDDQSRGLTISKV